MYLPSFSNVYVTVFTANMLLYIAGTVLTWSSPVVPKMAGGDISRSPFDMAISLEQASWISSLVTLGAAVGPFVFGWLANKIGRKPTLLYLGIPFLVGYSMLAFGKNVETYYVARFVCGVAVGGAFTVLPTYISEVAPPRQLGALSSSMGCFCCLGLFSSVCIGPFVNVRVFSLLLAFVPCAYLIAFCWIAPESPAFLVESGESQFAREILQKMGRNKEEVEKEIEALEAMEKERESVTFFDIFRSKCTIKALAISVGLMIFQQFSGINAVLFYSQRIFKESGSQLAPEYATMIIVGIQFLSSFLTPLVADRYGRKSILLCSTIGMAISEAPLGVYCYLKSHSVNMDLYSFIPLVALTAFIAFFNIGIGPLPWLIICEVFPTSLRSLASALVSVVIWLLSFVVTKYFGQAMRTFGLGELFMFFASCCVVATFFVLFFVLETKGKCYQEIEIELNK